MTERLVEMQQFFEDPEFMEKYPEKLESLLKVTMEKEEEVEDPN